VAYEPPWKYSFAPATVVDARPACIYCGNTEVPVLLGEDRKDVGVCEGCAAHVRWLWRQMPGDSAPVGEPAKVSRIKVLISKLRSTSEGQTVDSAAIYSYEFGLCEQSDGKSLDLPTTDLVGSETELDAVERSCSSLLVATWSRFIEPLYVAHTPRGRLVRLYLVTAYADASIVEPPRLLWRTWPFDRHVSDGMRGFYTGFRDVFELRLWKHRGQDPRTAGVTTHVREGAARYIKMQQLLRSGKGDRSIDTSMASYWRQSMSEDEKLVDKLLCEHEHEVASRSSGDGGPVESAESTVAVSGGPPKEISVGPPPETYDEPAAAGDDEGDDVDFE
jgi:hypothetical protein